MKTWIIIFAIIGILYLFTILSQRNISKEEAIGKNNNQVNKAAQNYTLTH